MTGDKGLSRQNLSYFALSFATALIFAVIVMSLWPGSGVDVGAAVATAAALTMIQSRA